jgi:hypothetical protein
MGMQEAALLLDQWAKTRRYLTEEQLEMMSWPPPTDPEQLKKEIFAIRESRISPAGT